MAADVVFGPTLPTVLVYPRLSISSSSQTSPESSESPKNPSTYSFSVRYSSEAPSETVTPKIEELDEEGVDDVKIPLADDASLPSPTTSIITKRPRGRPRKHPVSPSTPIVKPSKGRSKTGCITCRRRKKKCDEAKPHCLCCQKNNVHCEGYQPKEYWKSGKQKALEGRRASIGIPKELPQLIVGVEDEVDRFFLDHFNYNVSRVLSLFTEKHNPFKELLLPMAIRHRGLMHSLLCLSGSHLTTHPPADEDNLRLIRFENRKLYHFDRALENLRKDENMAKSIAGDSAALIDDPTVAQTLVLCLKTIIAGEVNGEYRSHMDVTKYLYQTQTSPNVEFQTFLAEFFIYHDVSNSVTSLDRRSLLMDDFELPKFMVQPEAGALLGVVDGLFVYLSKIRQLRDKIRWRKTQNLRPLVDYELLSSAQAIDAGLRTWECAQKQDTPRYMASMLYRQCTWLYLHRTILPSQPSPNLAAAVDEGLEYLKQLPPDASTQSILLMPLFLLGCAAFAEYQRPPIREAFAGLQAYSNLGNIKYAKAVVEKVWEMMDAGDEESWDWETIQQKQGWDFLVT
ncbi:hypothetical protein M501DRAFT_999808 [Patellaria atrata CBS 101060]|uniref:Zn(2)-C6 fungal-type domain-containing protein n=1 Tax=Patellaria atrata CBS 101060 TaxID=1346257 RepID=A0A9P4S1Y4_9PEZI|nr:hypothetical protein M501DRAFT_999808 [Patellaria atrata CBS 101060]